MLPTSRPGLTFRQRLVARGSTIDDLGRALLDQRRAAEAEESFRRALALAAEGGGPGDLLGVIQDLQKVKRWGLVGYFLELDLAAEFDDAVDRDAEELSGVEGEVGQQDEQLFERQQDP